MQTILTIVPILLILIAAGVFMARKASRKAAEARGRETTGLAALAQEVTESARAGTLAATPAARPPAAPVPARTKQLGAPNNDPASFFAAPTRLAAGPTPPPSRMPASPQDAGYRAAVEALARALETTAENVRAAGRTPAGQAGAAAVLAALSEGLDALPVGRVSSAAALTAGQDPQ